MLTRELDKLDLLRQSTLFQTFDDVQLRLMSALAHSITFAKNEHFFFQDDPGDCMFIIVSGYVRVYLSSPNGDEATFRIYKCGETFGEFAVLDGKLRTASAVTLSDVVALVLYRDDLFRLMETNPKIATRIIEELVSRLRFTTNYARNLAFLNAIGRVAAALAQLAEREAKEPGPVQIKMTQEELAHATGATREWVNRALRTLAEEEHPLIQRGRRSITVLDRERLQLWAELQERHS